MLSVSMVRAGRLIALFGLLLAGGCSPGGIAPATPDAGPVDANPTSPDSAPPSSGLSFTFRSDPELPTPPDGEYSVVVESGHIEMHEFRAIGDSAPGDARTTQDRYLLDLSNPNAQVTFADAPPGVYSLLIAEVEAFYVTGHVSYGDKDVDFVIDDIPPFEISLNVDLQSKVLDSGPLVIPLKAEILELTRAINWQTFSQEDDIQIDGFYSKIGDVRDKMQDVIKLDE